MNEYETLARIFSTTILAQICVLAFSRFKEKKPIGSTFGVISLFFVIGLLWIALFDLGELGSFKITKACIYITPLVLVNFVKISWVWIHSIILGMAYWYQNILTYQEFYYYHEVDTLFVINLGICQLVNLTWFWIHQNKFKIQSED